MPKKTRRKNGTGSIRPHGNGYEASVYVNGKRLFFNVKTKAEAAAVIRQAVHFSLDMSRKGNPKNMTITVEEFSIEWLHRIANLKINTRYGHERILHQYILPYFYPRLVSEITTQDVQDFVESLKIDGKSAKTIKNIVSVLSAIMSDAVRHNILPFNPVRGVKLPVVHNVGKTSQVMDEDYYFLLNLLITERPPFSDFFCISLLTGARFSELVGLTWDKIDFEKHTITIDCQLQYDKLNRSGYYKCADKSFNSRTFVVPKQVLDFLHAIKQLQDQRIAAGDYMNTAGYVFVNDEGNHLTATPVREAFRSFIRSHSELPQDLRIHDLRGSFATQALALGISPKFVSYQLAHRDVGFTMNRYGRVPLRLQNSAAMVFQQDLSQFDGLDDKLKISARLKSLENTQEDHTNEKKSL